MSLNPSDATAETIPGDPSKSNSADAETEFDLLHSGNAGQPYLMAVKLRDEPGTLHLRAYLANPSEEYAWADAKLTPPNVQALMARTSQRSALAWSSVQSGGTAPSAKIAGILSDLATAESFTSFVDALDADTGRELAAYLKHPAYGLFFDSTRNHDAWLQPVALPETIAVNATPILDLLDARFPAVPQGDAAAETLEVSVEEVDAFRDQIEHKNYEVADSHSTVKTRGSAQRAFSEAVKTNYGFQCAITGITTRDFLVGAHIVPWSIDQSIRLDPANGICLSLLVDRAFEKGQLIIADDLVIRIDWGRIGDDQALRKLLEPYEGETLKAPKKESPKPEYLQRKRALVG